MIETHDGVRALNIAGGLSAAVAALHAAIALIGARAYRYFGAGERMARLAERGSLWPTAVTLLLTLIFALWAAYAFSGADRIGRLPALKTSLVLIGAVYTLRGLVLMPQIALFLGGAGTVPPRHLFFSAASLLIGLLYLFGTYRAWPRL